MNSIGPIDVPLINPGRGCIELTNKKMKRQAAVFQKAILKYVVMTYDEFLLELILLTV